MKYLSVVVMILSFLILIACNDSESTSTANDPSDSTNDSSDSTDDSSDSTDDSSDSTDDSSDSANDPTADHVSTLLTNVDSTAPAETVKICFIHHSTGSAWISDSSGGLGAALNANNYYVTESDYGWDAEAGDNLGNRTDTEDWPEWFTNEKMPYVYANNAHYDYTNTIDDPTGENDIIMFKSCYPNSEVGDSIDDEKQLYLDLLNYFENHRDKMFVLIVPPPEIVIDSGPLTRELTNWLVDYENGWLSSYDYFNVHAFDYYNVLTDPNNHHRVEGDDVVHTVSGSPVDGAAPNELYYYTGTNNHPTAEGHQKATAEYVPLLNAYYHIWQDNT
jgi:hypothetical protein